VRIVDFCRVWGWCSLKHEKVAPWEVGTRSVGLVGSICQLTPLSVGSLWVNFLPVCSLYVYFKKQNNAYEQEEVR